MQQVTYVPSYICLLDHTSKQLHKELTSVCGWLLLGKVEQNMSVY